MKIQAQAINIFFRRGKLSGKIFPLLFMQKSRILPTTPLIFSKIQDGAQLNASEYFHKVLVYTNHRFSMHKCKIFFFFKKTYIKYQRMRKMSEERNKKVTIL